MGDLIWVDDSTDEYLEDFDGGDRLDLLEVKDEIDRRLPRCPENTAARLAYNAAVIHTVREGGKTWRDLWNTLDEVVEGGESGDKLCEEFGVKTGSQRAIEKAHVEAQQRAALARPRTRIVFDGTGYRELDDRDPGDISPGLKPSGGLLPTPNELKRAQEQSACGRRNAPPVRPNAGPRGEAANKPGVSGVSRPRSRQHSANGDRAGVGHRAARVRSRIHGTRARPSGV